MTKSKEKVESCPFVVSAHRQHNSLVTTIPKAIIQALGIQAGDIVCFDLQCGKGYAKFTLQLKGPKHNDGAGSNRSQKHPRR